MSLPIPLSHSRDVPLTSCQVWWRSDHSPGRPFETHRQTHRHTDTQTDRQTQAAYYIDGSFQGAAYQCGSQHWRVCKITKCQSKLMKLLLFEPELVIEIVSTNSLINVSWYLSYMTFHAKFAPKMASKFVTCKKCPQLKERDRSYMPQIKDMYRE